MLEKAIGYKNLKTGSDANAAANWLIEKVGGEDKANEILRTNYSYLLQKAHVEKIPTGKRNGQTYNNLASPNDFLRFLRLCLTMSFPMLRK